MKHVSGPEMCRVLERNGWTLAHIRSGHHIYNRPDARRPIPVPIYSSRSLKTGTEKASCAKPA